MNNGIPIKKGNLKEYFEKNNRTSMDGTKIKELPFKIKEICDYCNYDRNTGCTDNV